MSRKYSVSSWLAPGLTSPDDTIAGGPTVAPIDAARRYVSTHLPGYRVISCRYEKAQETERHGLHSLYRAECINDEAQLGATLWVREVAA